MTDCKLSVRPYYVYVGAGTESYLGTSVKNAVITVPAYFNDSQRQVHISFYLSFSSRDNKVNLVKLL